MPLVTSGVEHGNLRELALARMKVSDTLKNINIHFSENLQIINTIL
jgi:hypothetical protein